MVAPSLVTVTSCVAYAVSKAARGRRREGQTYTNVVDHHLVEAAGAKGCLDDICNSLCGEDWQMGRLVSNGAGMECEMVVRWRMAARSQQGVPFWSRMSEPEIFWPPKKRVPFLGCSNMDAISAAVRDGVDSWQRGGLEM